MAKKTRALPLTNLQPHIAITGNDDNDEISTILLMTTIKYANVIFNRKSMLSLYIE